MLEWGGEGESEDLMVVYLLAAPASRRQYMGPGTKKPASARRDQVNESSYQSLMLAAELLEARNLQTCTHIVARSHCPLLPLCKMTMKIVAKFQFL